MDEAPEEFTRLTVEALRPQRIRGEAAVSFKASQI